MLEKATKYREKAVLGERVRNIDWLSTVDNTANQINAILNPINGDAARRVDNDSVAVIKSLAVGNEWSPDLASDLVYATKDPNRPANRDSAERRVDILANATYWAMKKGSNPSLTSVLETGMASEIDAVLPAPLKGLGERIRDVEYTSPGIRGVLDKLDRTSRGYKMAGDGGKEGLVNNLNTALNELNNMIATSEKEDDEMMQVSAYIGWEIEKEKLSQVGGNNDALLNEMRMMRESSEVRAAEERQMFTVQAENQARQLKLSKDAEATTYQAWLSTILSKSGQAGLPSAIWAFEPPDNYKGEDKNRGAEWNDFLDTVTSFSNKAMTRRAALGGARDIGKAYFDQNYPKVQERSFALTYNDRRTGMAAALENIVKDLYVEAITTPDGVVRAITPEEVKSGKHGIFVMKYDVKGVPPDDQFGAKVMSGRNEGGRRKYLVRIAEQLVQSGVVIKSGDEEKDKELGSMMASMALDFLELGFGMDGPDHMRRCNFAVEGARTKSRPGYKFGDKSQGGEVFTGSWTAYYKERYTDEIQMKLAPIRASVGGLWSEKHERDATNQILVSRARKDGLIPQVLCGSILDIKVPVWAKDGLGKAVYDEKGDRIREEIIMGRALQAGRELAPYEESTEDMLFPIDKWFENASSFWDYVSGASKLDFKGGIRETDTILREFAKDLNNSYIFLHDKGIEVDVNQLIAAIGGAAGLIPSVPMALNIPVSGRATYSFLGNTLLNDMPGLTGSEISKVKERLAIDNPIADKLLLWWELSKDGKMTRGQREKWRRVLLNKPQGLDEEILRSVY